MRSEEAGDASDSCRLLSTDELERLAGTEVRPGRPVLVGSLPACKWQTDTGFVQVGSMSSADWAQGLPELLRTLEASGLADSAEDKRTLAKARDLIGKGRAVTPTQACAAFSAMLEIQGEPPGTTSTVHVWPSNENPQALAAQMCSAGTFTTVTLMDEEGVEPALLAEKVVESLRIAHRRGLD